MKVVLFCGGFGTRLREHSGTIPKPLVNIGPRPILWHLMRYYAHFGHKEFILCLGYRGDMIREYFLNYNECMSSDFTLADGGRTVQLHGDRIDDWKITFVDTGLHASIGQRLKAVRSHVGTDEEFLANYADGLSDLPLDRMIDQFRARRWFGILVMVRSSQSVHLVEAVDDGTVTRIGPMQDDSILVNGGFFVLRREIFDYLDPDDDLVERPFARLIAEKKLGSYRHLGFWQAMETFKDKIQFDRMEARGECPWMLWKSRS